MYVWTREAIDFRLLFRVPFFQSKMREDSGGEQVICYLVSIHILSFPCTYIMVGTDTECTLGEVGFGVSMTWTRLDGLWGKQRDL